jgi:hypothetical protein
LKKTRSLWISLIYLRKSMNSSRRASNSQQISIFLIRTIYLGTKQECSITVSILCLVKSSKWICKWTQKYLNIWRTKELFSRLDTILLSLKNRKSIKLDKANQNLKMNWTKENKTVNLTLKEQLKIWMLQNNVIILF